MSAARETHGTWTPPWPCPVALNLAPLRRGGGDPTFRIAPDGAHWLGIRTPTGSATLRILPRAQTGQVEASAWGAGADWALDSIPDLLGAADDPSGFEPAHPILERTWRRHQHWRLARTGRVWEALAPAIIEQKVTGQEAFAGFRMLVRRFGEPAPGPGADLGLWVQPSAATVRSIPSWEWLRMHIDPARSRTLVGAAARVSALEGVDDPALLDARLRSLPGIGVWTSAEVRARALGDADAVSFGDYHVAAVVGYVLTGVALDDAGLAQLLEPWRPHRHRVQRLVEMSGLSRPRRGARMAPRTHLPARVTRA